MALESLDALDVLLKAPTATDDFERIITESALLNNALVLYVRATKTTSQERGGFDLSSRFSAEERVTHKELSDLRDHAIAHFGSGGSYKGEWQAELVVLQFKGEDASPASSPDGKRLIDNSPSVRGSTSRWLTRSCVPSAWKSLPR
jgi:hypothetical protein